MKLPLALDSQTDRRTFLAGTGAVLLAAPLAAEAQQARRKVSMEYRWAEGKADRFPVRAAEFVRLKVDVIVAAGPLALRALQQATSTIPIVSAALPGRPGQNRARDEPRASRR